MNYTQKGTNVTCKNCNTEFLIDSKDLLAQQMDKKSSYTCMCPKCSHINILHFSNLSKGLFIDIRI